MGFIDTADSSVWAGWSPIELLDHLEQTHHLYLRYALPRVTDLHRRVTRAHGWEYPELFTVGELFEELRLDLEPHVAKEERVLFPLVRELVAATSLPSFDCGSIRSPIEAMLRDHAQSRDLFAQLSEASHGYVVPSAAADEHRALFAALAHLDQDTRVHHRKENDVLFPAVLELEAHLAR